MIEAEQQPFDLRGTFFCVCLACLGLLVHGCMTPLPKLGGDLYSEPTWRANVVTALAMDYREDGDFDMTDFDGAPESVVAELKARALEIVENEWDGE